MQQNKYCTAEQFPQLHSQLKLKQQMQNRAPVAVAMILRDFSNHKEYADQARSKQAPSLLLTLKMEIYAVPKRTGK
jgi:hypothetical protein